MLYSCLNIWTKQNYFLFLDMANRTKNKEKRLFIIYCLLDPRNNSIFYVGCTCDLTLRGPLYRHIYEACANWAYQPGSVYHRKKRLIKEILFLGEKPLIKALAIVQHELSGICEKFYYNYFTKAGYELIQNPDQLIYERQY